MNLIDLDDLLKWLEDWKADLYDTSSDRQLGVTDAIVIACQMPDVDAAPVRHGKWTRHTVGSGEYGKTVMYRCNECEMVTISRFKYCPHCGARMDGNEKTD